MPLTTLAGLIEEAMAGELSWGREVAGSCIGVHA
jgi:hypothetical protein